MEAHMKALNIVGAVAGAIFRLVAAVAVVYVILMSDEIIKMPICWWRYRKYKWLRDVTRDM